MGEKYRAVVEEIVGFVEAGVRAWPGHLMFRTGELISAFLEGNDPFRSRRKAWHFRVPGFLLFGATGPLEAESGKPRVPVRRGGVLLADH